MLGRKKRLHVSSWSWIRVLVPGHEPIEHKLRDDGYLLNPVRCHRRNFRVGPNGSVNLMPIGGKTVREPEQKPAPESRQKELCPDDQAMPEIHCTVEDEWEMWLADTGTIA